MAGTCTHGLMLQQKEPDDYIIATCECHSVKEFVEKAFKVAGGLTTKITSGLTSASSDRSMCHV